MAGRGTDIILGGNIIFQIKKKLISLFFENSHNLKDEEKIINSEYLNNKEQLKKIIINLPYSLDLATENFKVFYKKLYSENFLIWEKENQLVKDLGGLFVLGTERHENRRIDNQLRGRAGRQGDPGISQFFISLDDDLIKIFGGENIRKLIKNLIDDENIPLESSLLTKSIENAQKKIESYNYELRKNIFQYDEILNFQRKEFFSTRNELLKQNIYDNLFLRYLEFLNDEKKKLKKQSNKELWLTYDLHLFKKNLYQKNLLKNTRSIELLNILDYHWTEHIERMEYIRETINWKAYGQENPLIEYNNKAYESFKFYRTFET